MNVKKYYKSKLFPFPQIQGRYNILHDIKEYFILASSIYGDQITRDFTNYF